MLQSRLEFSDRTFSAVGVDLIREVANRLGFATHVSIAQHLRLILEIPRGSERYRQLHVLRSISDRTNSTLKDDNATHCPESRKYKGGSIRGVSARLVFWTWLSSRHLLVPTRRCTPDCSIYFFHMLSGKGYKTVS